MLTPTDNYHQTNFFGTDLVEQLDPKDPLILLANVIPWSTFDKEFSQYYAKNIGSPRKPIRLMVGPLILKKLENSSDEKWFFSGNEILIIKHFVALRIFKTVLHVMQLNWLNSDIESVKMASKKYLKCPLIFMNQQKKNRLLISTQRYTRKILLTKQMQSLP
jgi:hypothetical protein